MSKQMSLKEAESRVFKLSQFQDGWWDILLGGEFVYLSFYDVLAGAFGAAGQFHAVFMGVLAVLVTIYLAARKLFVTPRIGSVKFGIRQNRQKRKLWAATIILGSVDRRHRHFADHRHCHCTCLDGGTAMA